MRRLFFALWPSDAVRAQLAQAAAAIDPGDGRRVATANLHVTVLFLGEVADGIAERLCAAADGSAGRGFELHVDAAGWWRRSAVVWLAPSLVPPALLSLVEQLRELVSGVDIPLEARPYRPHVTVYRRAHRPPRSARIGCRWRIDEFSLIESLPGAAGVRYQVLRRWPLDAGDRSKTAPDFLPAD
jgi:RNA 2',3'-cyclic 3'-phosphodiesterase